MFQDEQRKSYNRYMSIARNLLEAGNLPDALKAVRRAMEVDPSSQEAYSLYTDICCRDERHPFTYITVMYQLIFLGHYFGLDETEESLTRQIDVREMHSVHPDGSIKTSDAVCLELSNSPRTMMQVQVTPDRHVFVILKERPIPGVHQDTWVHLIEPVVMPDLRMLPDVLKKVIEKDLFVRVGNELIFRA